MNPELSKIFDQALTVALGGFLLSLTASLLFVYTRVRRVRKGLAHYYFEKMEGSHQVEAAESVQSPLAHGPAFGSGPIIRTLVLSLAVSAVSFIVVLFTPVTYFPNLATGHSWKVIPLRLTSLNHDRSDRGFSLRGEVWNQTSQVIQDLGVVITVWSDEQSPSAEVVQPVKPRLLPPGTAGTFRIRYRQDSPLLHGYQVEFLTSEGISVRYVKGFDAR